MSKKYLARYRQGTGPMDSNFIDFYEDGNDIVMHSYAMGGESKTFVTQLPQWIEGYELLPEDRLPERMK